MSNQLSPSASFEGDRTSLAMRENPDVIRVKPLNFGSEDSSLDELACRRVLLLREEDTLEELDRPDSRGRMFGNRVKSSSELTALCKAAPTETRLEARRRSRICFGVRPERTGSGCSLIGESIAWDLLLMTGMSRAI